MTPPSSPRQCSLNNTVVATVVLPGFMPSTMELARSALRFGFPCVVATGVDNLQRDDEDRRHLLLMDAGHPALLPRAQWCNHSQYWHRRAQFLRMRLWRLLLDEGLDVLAVDASQRLRRNPLGALSALHTRSEAQYGAGKRPDVIGGTPGWFLKQYVLSAGVWIRSTTSTRQLLHRSELRVVGCWDETVFTEELNWGSGRNVTCCHAECFAKQFSTRPVVRGADRSHAARRTCAEDGAMPLAPAPPIESRNGWASPENGTRR